MLPDVAVHLIQRGNNRVVCFPADNDYAHYLFHLRRSAPMHGCAVHAYCLMPNHVHLLVTPKHLDSCAGLMKELGQLHAQYINGRYGRSGTLWEGRFKSCLVQSRSYALACHRYIELNPVRASLVSRPADYQWSSFATNGLGVPDSLIQPHPEYLGLGQTAEARLAAYLALVNSAPASDLDGEIRSATRGGLAFGDTAFKRHLSARLGRSLERGHVGRPPNEDGSAPGQLEIKL